MSPAGQDETDAASREGLQFGMPELSVRVVDTDSTRHPDRDFWRDIGEALTLWRVCSRLTAALSTNHGIPPPNPAKKWTSDFPLPDLANLTPHSIAASEPGLPAFTRQPGQLGSEFAAWFPGNKTLVIRNFRAQGPEKISSFSGFESELRRVLPSFYEIEHLKACEQAGRAAREGQEVV